MRIEVDSPEEPGAGSRSSPLREERWFATAVGSGRQCVIVAVEADVMAEGSWECFLLHRSGENPILQERDLMNWLLIVAVLLLVLWVAAEVVGWVIGAALHLLWIAALVLFAIWVVQKIRARA